jgi:hypothetical protein
LKLFRITLNDYCATCLMVKAEKDSCAWRCFPGLRRRVTDVSLRARLWCHNAINRVFTSTGRIDALDLVRGTWSSIACPEALRCSVLQEPAFACTSCLGVNAKTGNGVARCVFQVRMTVFLWRKFSDHASGPPGFSCGIDLHRIMILEREHDSGESNGT